MKLISRLTIACTLAFSAHTLNAFELDCPKEYAELDGFAVQTGTDKSSNYHNYTKTYARYFKDLRNKPIRFLEIGILFGNSVKLWENYFPNAELHFIDNIPAHYIPYHSARSQYHYIDQENVEALQKFARSVNGKFDVIIDDGGHFMNQQINSVAALFPFLKSGGMYIIEDLCTSYWKEFGGAGTQAKPDSRGATAVSFLKDLVDAVNAVGAKTRYANFDMADAKVKKGLTFWEKEVRSIHFYDSMCIIFKR